VLRREARRVRGARARALGEGRRARRAAGASLTACRATAQASPVPSALSETIKMLTALAEQHDSLLVSYSGGKDSNVILDLATRTFKRVECFFMYFVPDLECIEEALDGARRRYGVPIHQYPHWLLGRTIASGAYCLNRRVHAEFGEWSLRDIYTLAVADTKIQRIATGAKRDDSLWRRRNMSQTRYADVVYPIEFWNKLDVVGYLRSRGLPIPSSTGRNASGIDLSTPSLLWLHDNHPRDFQRLCEVFPFAEAVIWRRTWYGVK
jgi:3'-phosphoadenosine 5'-phosphosulfate sulfotransferase (PAPS reductase)/FAD synthetase